MKSNEDIALETIRNFLINGNTPVYSESDFDEKQKRKKACFVTVYVDGKLRGCIGNAEPVGPLWKSITENAVAAITSDTRFDQITKEELARLTVEVSVLSPMMPFKPKNSKELLWYLQSKKPGLVIQKGYNRALFLPQVWEQLPNAKNFLANLCFKAGLPDDAWKENGMHFMTFVKEE